MAVISAACASPSGRKNYSQAGAGGQGLDSAHYNLPYSILRIVRDEIPPVVSQKEGDDLRISILSRNESRSGRGHLPLYDYLSAKASSCRTSSPVKASELLSAATISADLFRNILNRDLALVAGIERKSAVDKAIVASYYKTVLVDLAQMEELNNVIQAAGGTPVELPLKEKIYSSLHALFGRPVVTPEDMADFFAFSLNAKTMYNCRIVPFVFGDTQMTGPAGRYLAEVMDARFRKVPSWWNGKTRPDKELSGNYWVQDGMLHVVATIRSLPYGGLIRVAEASIPQEAPMFAEDNLKPRNFDKALSVRRYLEANWVKGCGRALVVFANDSDRTACVRGQEIKISPILNTPSYLRVIQYLADGSPILLVDNYFVDSRPLLSGISSKEFSAIKCGKPYGAGFVQVVASPDLFEPLRVKESNGQNYILDTPEEIARNNHGKLKDGVSQRAETWLTITSMEE